MRKFTVFIGIIFLTLLDGSNEQTNTNPTVCDIICMGMGIYEYEVYIIAPGVEKEQMFDTGFVSFPLSLFPTIEINGGEQDNGKETKSMSVRTYIC